MNQLYEATDPMIPLMSSTPNPRVYDQGSQRVPERDATFNNSHSFLGTLEGTVGFDWDKMKQDGITFKAELAPIPQPAGQWRFGRQAPVHGSAFHIVSYHQPRWLTRKMMAWFFELHWVPSRG